LTVSLTVHRATHEIGGNCIEIAADGHRIILDVGRPLDAERDASGLLPRSLDVTTPADAVLISHPHQDHYGLLDEVPDGWPVHCGEATRRLIAIGANMFGKPVANRFVPWTSGMRFEIGPFAITPFLTDHSAFDAHMLLIEAEGKRIFYSGDFRTHGRKSALPERLMAAPPHDVDVLLMEGTNLGSGKPCVSEDSLEDEFVDLFRTTRGRAFVAWSAQNVDRTVTLYRACLKTGRTLAVDLYTAEVMETLAEFGRLPRPGWRNLKVVITGAFARMYRKTGRAEFVDRMAAHGIAARRLAEQPERWVVMTRPSLIRDYAPNGVTPTRDDAWSWSMWSGYLRNEDGERVRQWFEGGNCPARHIHTSGHASPAELRAFANAIGAKCFVPIHGLAWDGDVTGFPTPLRLADGEALQL
jgi:ribonuclease J